MRIALADYSGHAFPTELSRELARRGHQLLHLYFAEFQSPKGDLLVGPADPPCLTIEAVSLGRPFAKHDLIRRRSQEIEIGRRFAVRVAAFSAEAVIGCNMPLDTMRMLQKEALAQNRIFLFWQQDIYSVAIARILVRKLGMIGNLIGRFYRAMEGRLLRASDAVVVISEDFLVSLRHDFGVTTSRIHVVENWGQLGEITPRPKDNPWSRAHGLTEKTVVLYTGTLGMKHDPTLILAVAESLRDRPGAEVVVASEGPFADRLRRQAHARGLSGLRVLGFQSFANYPDVLASADVVLSILESDSGSFCVPSKILSYLCAGRPIAMSGPLDNLSARILEQSGGGVMVAAGDSAALVAAVLSFLDDAARHEQAGRSGRAYAEATFAIAGKADRFEAILAACAAGAKRP